jgi:hypothetical protein
VLAVREAVKRREARSIGERPDSCLNRIGTFRSGELFRRRGIGAAQLGVGRGPNAHRGPAPGSVRARRRKKVEKHDRNDDYLAEKHAECGEFFHGRDS